MNANNVNMKSVKWNSGKKWRTRASFLRLFPSLFKNKKKRKSVLIFNIAHILQTYCATPSRLFLPMQNSITPFQLKCRHQMIIYKFLSAYIIIFFLLDFVVALIEHDTWK